MPSTIVHTVITQSDEDQVIPARSRTETMIDNVSGSTCYLRLGAVATTTVYTIAIADGGYYEVPGSYDGTVHVIWAEAGSGELMVTELRP